MLICYYNDFINCLALPSLIQFDLEYRAFSDAEVINLSGLSFFDWVIILDLPSFEVLNMNNYALEGDWGRYSASNYVYSYYNTITLKSNLMLFYHSRRFTITS